MFATVYCRYEKLNQMKLIPVLKLGVQVCCFIISHGRDEENAENSANPTRMVKQFTACVQVTVCVFWEERERE